MENKAKIRINLNLREFEIEGSEDFINSHSAKIESFLEILKNIPPSQAAPVIQQPATNSYAPVSPSSSVSSNQIPDNFGEYYHLLPKTAKDADKVLIAGYFHQLNNPDAYFTTGDATKLLIDQGVKLSNPAQFIGNNVKVKRIIKLGKGKFKVSKDGVEYIQQLLIDNK
jgi:hypothetical protein